MRSDESFSFMNDLHEQARLDPFVDGVFNAECTDRCFERECASRSHFPKAFGRTNYSVVHSALLEEVYRQPHEQQAGGEPRHRFSWCREVQMVERVGRTSHLRPVDSRTGLGAWHEYHGTVPATGYQHIGYQQRLADLAPWMTDDSVTHDYRLTVMASFQGRVFLEGCCERTHGPSDILPSIVAVRSRDVAHGREGCAQAGSAMRGASS